MSFFERYFAALDGPDPYASLDLVADDLELAIEWAAGPGRKAVQITGGRRELRAFIDAGERGGWAHHLLHIAGDDQTEFALGETRYDSGERIGTFVAVAELDSTGRMRRYLVGRSPALAFGQKHQGQAAAQPGPDV
ncbi:MAG TPA: hypothetical protein VF933_01955 [Streptosporangiaceae bacterium]